MSDAVLVLNAGSSSIKFGLFEIFRRSEPEPLSKGLIEGIDAEPRLTVKDSSERILFDRRWHSGDSEEHENLLAEILNWVDAHLAKKTLVAAGHRIVHGGRDFVAPVQLTDHIIDALNELTPLAPLHQPHCLSPARALMSLRPGLPQIACFDTAFHHGLRAPVSRFAIPRSYEESGIRRYGFHGLSYEFIAHRLREISPALAGKRTVVAHLGNGASLCAMRDSQSVDTTMGFTALDGLMMGTRCGAVDPGVLLYLQQARGMSVGDLEQLLYHDSGLLGVSGISSDMRTLLASDDPRAAEAVDLFTFRIARGVSAMANSLGGLECLIFTGGIGEHAKEVREMVCDRLRWLGVKLEPSANDQAKECISSTESRVDIRVIPTSEETMIARHMSNLTSR